MAIDRELIEYLPSFMREYKEIQQIMATEQIEIQSAWDAVEKVENNQFVASSDDDGLKRWEKILDIVPKATETLEERRFRVLSRINFELPYTIRRLKEILTTLCGDDGFEITVSGYEIEIKLALGNASMYQDVELLLNNTIPANMMQHISVLYNTYDVLSGFTHQELAAYTHREMKERVLA